MDLRHALRAATDREHRALDALLGAVWCSRETYRAYIAMNEIAYRAIEPGVVDALREAGDGLAYARVHDSLASDLDGLGGRPGPEPKKGARAAFTLAGAIGAIYVLEGSHLGARMLHARTVAAPWFDPHAPAPTAFFERARSTPNFNRRMAGLQRYVTDEVSRAQAISSALDTFAVFREAAERTVVR